MRATQWTIGCAFCLAFIGSAAATSLDTQEVDHATQVATSRASHDGDGTGDVVGMTRDSGAVTSGDATTGSSRNGNERSGAASSAPAPAPRPHLGWQSLLPGSIQ